MLNFGVTLAFVIFFIIPARAQDHGVTIKGRVIDEEGKALEYVNIGIPEHTVGTISHKDGCFTLQIPDSLLFDSLLFSNVGFESKIVSISSLLKKPDVALCTKTIGLSEVNIHPVHYRRYILGIKSRTPLIQIPSISYYDNDIIEQTRLIHLNETARIINTGIFLLATSIEDSIAVRLNFYQVKNGLPDERLIEKCWIKKFKAKKGWLIFNLEQDDIYIDGDFFVAFEYLPMDVGKKEMVSYGAKIGSTDSFLRKSSQGKWGKSQTAGTTIFMTVEK